MNGTSPTTANLPKMAPHPPRRDRRPGGPDDDRLPGQRRLLGRRGLHAAHQDQAPLGHRRRRPRRRRRPLPRSRHQAYARQAAKDIAAANLVAGQPLLLDDSDIVFGNSASNPAAPGSSRPAANRSTPSASTAAAPAPRPPAACRSFSAACSTSSTSSRRRRPPSFASTATSAWSSTAPAR